MTNVPSPQPLWTPTAGQPGALPGGAGGWLGPLPGLRGALRAWQPASCTRPVVWPSLPRTRWLAQVHRFPASPESGHGLFHSSAWPMWRKLPDLPEPGLWGWGPRLGEVSE